MIKIRYNEKDKSIEIKEDHNLETHYFAMKVVMILNLISAVLNMFMINKNDFGLISFFWMSAGIISLVVLYVYIFKHTTSAIIPIKNIKQLQEKSIFGRKQFFLKLNNGKKRPLTALKSEVDRIELRKLLSEIGIHN